LLLLVLDLMWTMVLTNGDASSAPEWPPRDPVSVLILTLPFS
jgi:hypothetical protein